MLKMLSVIGNIVLQTQRKTYRRGMTLDNIPLALVHPAKLVPIPFLFNRPKGCSNLAAHKRKLSVGDEMVLGPSLYI
jgi:hypothetical protein